MPRYEGLKYHFNELPFYYEGVLAGLIPTNLQKSLKSKEENAFKMVKTNESTFKENTRTEKAVVEISIDSLLARITTKETLSGQFSTLLRPLYLNGCIDSTIALHYFKKCVDKPNGFTKKIKLESRSAKFPFRYLFDCTEKISFKDTSKLSLKNWFSFVLSKQVIPEKPNFDYYFDFDYSDSYSFLFDFNKPVEIKNKNAFAKRINNAYFELESEISKTPGNSYLIKATFVVKQKTIPVDKINLLMEIVEQLDQINNFTLELSKN